MNAMRQPGQSGQSGVRRGACIALVLACLFLTACAGLDRKVQQVSVKSDIKEPVTSVALVFVTPEWANQNPDLVKGYRLSGVLDNRLMNQSVGHAADFMQINGVPAKYAGTFAQRSNIRGTMGEWSGQGYNTLLFVPVGSSVTSQGHEALRGTTRYRVTLYSKKLVPMLEFQDAFYASGPDSGHVDLMAAGWLNALMDNGYVVRKSDKLVEPPLRDFSR
jgi:hypothetical protein